MDAYRDLHRAPFSAGYYTSPLYPASYAVEPRSSYSLAAADPLAVYARFPADAYAAYSSSLPQPEPLPLSRYRNQERSYSPRRRFNYGTRSSAQAGRKRRSPPQNLTPKKTAFKKTQKKSQHTDSTPKKGTQGNAVERKSVEKEQISGNSARDSQNSLAASLAKETQELHSLYRTGVDPSTGKKLVKQPAKNSDATQVKKSDSNATGVKRKADVQQEDGAASSAKKSRGKNKKAKQKLAKQKKQAIKKDKKPVVLTPKAVKVPKPVVLTPKAVKAEPPALTEEEKKEVELSLALQYAACKPVEEFLGIPKKGEEPAKCEALDDAGAEAEPADAQPNADSEAQAKLNEATKATPLTPEEETELEEKSYKFFSKLLEENQILRNMYLEKKDTGTFECLLCRSIDPDTSKTFVSTCSLVLHTSMRRQKRPEHRGYAHALSDVLGWKSTHFPKQPAIQVKEEADPSKQPMEVKVAEEGKHLDK